MSCVTRYLSFSIHTEDSQYETDLSTDEILIADVSDVKNKKELSEKVSETLLQLLDIYLPDEIYGEFEDTDEGEEFHEHPGSPKVTFTEKKVIISKIMRLVLIIVYTILSLYVCVRYLPKCSQI